MTPTPVDATDGKSRRSEPRELEFERKGEKPSQVDRGTMFIRFVIIGRVVVLVLVLVLFVKLLGRFP